MHSLFVYELDIGNSDILEKSSKINNLITSSTINIPLISLGFQHFLHHTKDAMAITEKLETKNKFYNVMNPFEHVISNYEESLINITKQYFNNKDKAPEIMSRGFYKMWEILYLFGIVILKIYHMHQWRIHLNHLFKLLFIIVKNLKME